MFRPANQEISVLWLNNTKIRYFCSKVNTFNTYVKQLNYTL